MVSDGADEKMGVEEKLGILEAKLETYQDGLASAWDAIDALEESVQEMDDRIEELEDEVARLDSRTDLLDLVQSSDEMDGEQRSTALIQHLHKAAQKQRDRGEPAMASVNRDEAEAALQYPDVERTTIYRDMERAIRLVGNEAVLWYESASGGESRLKLNLETGDLSAKFTEEEYP